jgi:hypothetical protein
MVYHLDMETDKLSYEAIKSGVLKVDLEKGVVFSTRANRVVGGLNTKGYVVFTLHLNGLRKQIKVHRIIWIAKNGIPPLDKVIDHINGKKSDNRIVNLRLVGYLENSLNRRSYKGENNPSVKLTQKIVCQIRDEYLKKDSKYHNKLSYDSLSKKHGVSKTLIAKIIRKEIWNK